MQMDNLVDELTSDGYIKKISRTKIYLTDDGRREQKSRIFYDITFQTV